MSYETEKHRTFQFADLPEKEFDRFQNQCRIERAHPELAAVGLALEAPNSFLFGEEPSPEAYDVGPGLEWSPIGRHNYLRIRKPRDEWFTRGQWKVIAYPALKEREVVGRRREQDFEGHCTNWEHEYSPFIYGNDQSLFKPVVDQCGLVIGYYGQSLDPSWLYVTRHGELVFAKDTRFSMDVRFGGARPFHGSELWMTSQGQVQGWVDGAENLPPLKFSQLYHDRIETSGETSDVLVDIDGYVVSIHFRSLTPDETELGRAIKAWTDNYPLLAFLLPTIPNPSDPYSMPLFVVETMFLFVSFLGLGETKIGRSVLSKLFGVSAREGRYARAGIRAMTASQQMTTLIVRARMVRIGQDLQWARRAVFGNYFRQSGMPLQHFLAAQKAVDEMETYWVLMRSTNQKSMEGILKGFPPKGLDLKVKTSKTTGIVTCRELADRQSAWKAGHFVVEKDTQGWRAVLRDPESPLKTKRQVPLTNTNWPVEEGQVIRADEWKPFVGDYDIFDVFEPARRGNAALAAEDGEILKSWDNPWTKEFASRANQGFDRPRMLHGGQGQFAGWIEVNGEMIQKKEISGVLDEPLLLLRPNQPAAWLPDKHVVETFYREMGRRTIGGK